MKIQLINYIVLLKNTKFNSKGKKSSVKGEKKFNRGGKKGFSR